MGLRSVLVTIALIVALAGTITPASAATNTICALDRWGSGVYRWDEGSWSWQWIGGTADGIWGGRLGLFATNPDNKELWKYNGQPGSWQRIGGGGVRFAVTEATIYGVATDGRSTWRWNGGVDDWSYVGEGKALVAGGWDSVYSWGTTWDEIANKVPSCAVGGDGELYTVGSDRQSTWTFRDWQWQRIGQGAEKVWAGGYAMVSTVKDAMYRHLSGTHWNVIGGGSDEVAISDYHIYSRYGDTIYRYSGNSGTNWDVLPNISPRTITPCP
ncbi:uncharacterized protein B0I36DRAFT_319440 [Microdochium trichocladiopsis]|uniref:Uncharacterized protein n=1 Tax=Microdochium trichocladiopsis TaxID=1682393 RepID=A0A9P8YFC6_9PEZI|nr:uncharacterized protein B0I36DRAFT_319440 [Microdochium trichocladiopsis]KAH7035958.1 hypothetical protein B0I36DRAFT_319440 [Microdochium trichocladiopsis]